MMSSFLIADGFYPFWRGAQATVADIAEAEVEPHGDGSLRLADDVPPGHTGIGCAIVGDRKYTCDRELPQGHRGVVPAGWPRQVRPPDAPDWEVTAVNWLLDFVALLPFTKQTVPRYFMEIGLRYIARRFFNLPSLSAAAGPVQVRSLRRPVRGCGWSTSTGTPRQPSPSRFAPVVERP